MSSGVYVITNIVNNKVYIGSASNIKARWNYHIWTLNKNTHHNIHLQRAWNKYDDTNFTFDVLEEVGICKLSERENYWMQYYKDNGYTLYNISPNAEHSILSEETKLKISRKNKGRPAWNKGIPCPINTRIKIRDANIGQVRTLDQLQRASGKIGGRKHSQETIEKMTKRPFTDIELHDIYNKQLEGYSVQELADTYDTNRESLRVALKRYVAEHELKSIDNRNSDRAVSKMLNAKPKKEKEIKVSKERKQFIFQERQLDYILKLFLGGTKTEDIGDLFNCSRSTISRALCTYKGVKNINELKE
jgi:group I intron endonuclease